jgi:acyl transferase domain-containing protein
MRGRFPGADNLEQFWKNLCDGVESIVTFSEQELRDAGVDPETKKLPNYVNRGCVLSDVEHFDAQFFGYSPRDAEVLDPQQRLFLEVAWESLEEAGYNPDAYPGMIGVYAGSEQSSYLFQLWAHGQKYMSAPMASIGNDKDYLTTQVSYKLNLRGPSIAVQTACSTSLVAVSLGCQALLSYQCDMALAGGVCVIVPQKKGYFYAPGSIHSPDGHCRTFDAAGQGTVVGSGVGVVVLKRLSEALADGDEIHAVIRGAALNNDGSLKVGFGAPSVEGQAQVIAMAQAMAGVDPETIEYIEAHGTATLLGDPIEMAALNQVFGVSTRKRGYCAIGSLKSNVGHLASAAGVAGLIKTALALKHEAIPPSLHFNKPNPQINFANSPFFVNTRLREWKNRGTPRHAGVSSFGVGGTNAHVILEDAPRREASGPGRPHQLIVLSAKTATALEAATDNVANHLERRPELNLADAAYTLQVGRKEFRHRRILVCRQADSREAVAALRGRNPQTVLTGEAETKDRPILFMFSGQGAQYVNMARDLYESEPTFREQLDLCCVLLEPHLGLDLREVIYPANTDLDEATARLTKTAMTQPALFTLEYALARLWIEWGVVPKAMVGHSIGEYVAACLAGVFSIEEALALVAYRGHLMDQMPAGSMLALPLSEKELQPLLGGDLSLAAVNGPSLSVASGPSEAIAALEGRLAAHGIRGRRLHTSHAFHSAMMDPIIEPFVTAVRAATLNPPVMPYFSNLTGTWATPEQATDPEYWGRHLRHTVRFADSLQELAKVPELIYLEVGPGQTLGTLARQQPGKAPDQMVLSSVHSAQEHQPDLEFLLNSLGRLWLSGVPVNWPGFSMHERRHRVALPTYPFERQRYWVGMPGQEAIQAAALAGGQDVTDWFYLPSWRPSGPPPAGGGVAEAGSHWLIFTDGEGFGDRLAARLEERGADAIRITDGDRFEKVDDRTYAIRPQQRTDYDAVLKDLRSRSWAPDRILHLWGAAPLTGDGLDRFEDEQTKGFYSFVFLAQALESQKMTHRMPVGVVTRGVHAVQGDEVLCPARSTVLGACKVVAQEYPNLRCRAIDLAADEAADLDVADRLIRELTAEAFSPVVAYRKGRRWTQTYESVRLAEASPDTLPLREKGVYLITGGLGKIGLAVAEFLGRTVKARLVLTGRSEFPDRPQWNDWLAAHGEDGATSRKIRRLLALEELGAEVAVFQADAADRDGMRAVIEHAVARFGELHGAIHGAGNTTASGFGPVNQLGAGGAEGQFRPKVHGAHVLEELLRGRPLDFCVLLSSLSTVLGGLGLLAYASANSYLDAFAARRNQSGSVPWININWDAWLFPEDIASGVAGGESDILPEAGVEAFRRILARAPRQVVVSTTDLQARLSKWVNLESLQEGKAGRVDDDSGLHPRPNLSTQYVAPRNEVEETIASVWQQILGVAPIGVYDKFFELGGHSLLAIQLISQLRDAFQVELSAQRLFEAPTIAELAESMEAERQRMRVEEEQREQERLAEMLQLVENLTDEQVAELLANEGGQSKGQSAHGGSD